jgi:hypothetical protein
MIDVYRAFQAESLKLKRTLALRLAIGCPTLIVLLVFAMYLRGGEMAGADPLTGYAQFILTIWAIIVFPLYGALAAALLAAIEHQNESWRHLLALPVARQTMFVAKWVAGFGLLLLSSLVLVIGITATAELLRVIKPSWGVARLPTVILKRSVMSACAAALLFSIQMWISLRWRSFLPGLVVGVIALAVMFVAIPRGLVMFGSVFPWSLPAMAMAPHNPHRPMAVGVGLLGGIVVGAAGCWRLSRREFC